MTGQAPPLRDMLAALIAAPSVSSSQRHLDQSNLRVIEALAEWLSAAGFAVEILPVPGHSGKANLIATLGQGAGGLVLAGHTDTVPFDADRWRHDPFQLTEQDGRLYGLGTSDMKSFLALAVESARGLSAQDLRQPLVILATADEESSMSGAIALAEAGRPLGRYAVIGEPTGLRPVRMHKGIMAEAIRLIGRAGHSSDPSLGNNALEGMHALIGEILVWRTELQRRHRHGAFQVAVPTLNLGHIHGGDSPNRICGECELHIDLRPTPGLALDDLRAELYRRVADLAARRGLDWRVERLFPGIPAVETPAGSAIVTAAEALTGQSAGAVAFATEAPFLDRLGMETLILGPGDIAQAHQPDEYLEADRIQPTIDLLRGLIRRFCQTETSS
jgi:acetylornithine deacetylase